MKVTEVQYPMELIRRGTNEECGCHEEEWIIGVINVILHIESDGSGEAFLDAGDWQDELGYECSGIYDLRMRVASYIKSLPIQG